MPARPIVRQLLISTALAAASAVAVGGCGSEPPREQVRVLHLSSGGLVTARQSGSAPVRAVLTSSRAPQLPPAMSVPQVGSIAAGTTNDGRLVKGLQLPPTGPDWVTFDPIERRTPNRPERRWATDRLLAFVLYVLRDYRLANPGAPPVVIGDLSRPHGGPFGSEFGGLGHASHQNGLDADIYYPRADRALRPPATVADVDRALAQDLVSRFVGAGAQFAFVGRHVGLGGPPGIVEPLAHHDDHVHVRIAG
jgi:murein endopeptidase